MFTLASYDSCLLPRLIHLIAFFHSTFCCCNLVSPFVLVHSSLYFFFLFFFLFFLGRMWNVRTNYAYAPVNQPGGIQIFICNLVANENSLEMHSDFNSTQHPTSRFVGNNHPRPPPSRRYRLVLVPLFVFDSDHFAERLSDVSYQIIYKLRLPRHAIINAKELPREMGGGVGVGGGEG